MATERIERGADVPGMTYQALANRILVVWLGLAAGLLALGVADVFVLQRARGVSNLYIFQQDIPLALGGLLVLLLLTRTRPTPATSAWTPPRGWPWGLGLLLGMAAAAGTWFAFMRYGMTADEFMADFDAQIFRQGHLFARLPEAWRPYATALQPMFMLETSGHVFWASAYLPVNAAFRSLAGLAGAQALVNPGWTVVSVVCVAGVARRLWPERPQAAWIAAVLLATSSQVLVTGMTAFAMPAHLGLNLIWLWCFLRGGRAGHAGALVAGFLATGLHQLVFHPLFAAPFVLQLWLERRWAAAAFYTLGYAAIGLFWLFYWTLALKMSGGAVDPAVGGGVVWFGQRLVWLLQQFDVLRVGAMAKDLLRFMVWQNPLTIPLAALAGVPALRAGGALRSLALGVALTLAAVFVLLPWQDHGWGYRYLHGLLGSVCLLATWGLTRAMDAMGEGDRAVMTSAFGLSAVASAVLLAPLCLWFAAGYVRPFAQADRAIHRADTDLVFLDGTDGWYLEALVRNDPELKARPLVLELDRLTVEQVRALCTAHSVAVFDQTDATALGLRRVNLPNPTARGLRAEMGRIGCGARHVAKAAP